MLIIKNACYELREILYEAKERVGLAMECKYECPNLSSVYIELVNNMLNQAEKLHNAIVEYIDKEKTKIKDIPESMNELWKFEHNIYLELYEKVKSKLSIYNKM